MSFSSIHFLCYLLVVFGIFFSLPDRYRNIFMLLASYFFYAYWSVKYLLLLILTMILDFLLALRIQSAGQERKRSWLILSLVCNLGILFVFKYFNLFADLTASVFGTKR